MSDELSAGLTALYARVPLGMRLGLEPMRAACAAVAHPERAFDIVHVAGTNGKGSTCAMVESIARASGLRTGLYTSPHLTRFAERIRLDGEPLDDEALASVLGDALRTGADLSFFETATLAALLAFRAARVELAVLEVGIGGRLDATNVIPPPRCAALTGVALDHQDKLGESLAEIAREKAAIAKRGSPFVLGRMPPDVRAVVTEVAHSSGARTVDAVDLPDRTVVGLGGPHQRENARVAWTIAGELGIPLDPRVRGLANARWPGRLERIAVPGGELAGSWILDGAHNPDGAAALVRALAGTRTGALVFGALGDKAWAEMLRILAAVDAPRFYVTPSGRAPAEPEALARVVPGTPVGSVEEGLRAARRCAGPDPVVVCGSLYLVGAVRARFLGLASDPLVAL